MIHLAADHTGYKRLQKIKSFLERQKIKFQDHSPEYIKGDDYPDYAHKVASEVAKNPSNKGILICGSGYGMAITANKTKKIRAITAHSKNQAKLARAHNNANIICLGARQESAWKQKAIIKTFLETSFEKGRHTRRIKKIES